MNIYINFIIICIFIIIYLLYKLNKKNKTIDNMANEIYELSQNQDIRSEIVKFWLDKNHILNYFTKTIFKK